MLVVVVVVIVVVVVVVGVVGVVVVVVVEVVVVVVVVVEVEADVDDVVVRSRHSPGARQRPCWPHPPGQSGRHWSRPLLAPTWR